MREIKFRAWVKTDKQMSYPANLYDIIMGSSDFSIDPPEDEEKEVIVMQYTGLKDKNGVEIYEGDLMFDGEEVGQILFQNGQFLYKDSTVYHELFEVADGCEVSGNIYENKELLND